MTKKSPRALLLVDWSPENGSFLFECLRRNGLDCDIMGADFPPSKWTPFNKIVSHWPRCFWVSLQALRLRHHYDYILAWQQTMGMFLGMFKFLPFLNTPKVFILVATIVERRNPIMEKFRRWFIAASWKNIDYIGFISDGYRRLMRDRFGISDSQAVLLTLPITYERMPDFSGFKADSYLFSGGLSYRDYGTLMEAAKKTSKQFVVATTDAYLKGLTIPDNVTVYRNAFGEAADELMKGAAAVILPLDRTESPAGESTLVSTMCHGKPVITTKTITTEEYIVHGENGLLVPWRDPDAIVEAIEALFADPEKANAMGWQARQTVLKSHTMDSYTQKVIDIINHNSERSRPK